MKNKILSLSVLVVAFITLISVVNAEGIGFFGKTLEYNTAALSGQATFGVDFYSKIYATKLSVATKPTIRTKAQQWQYYLWNLGVKKDEEITTTNKVYPIYYNGDKTNKTKITWDNLTKGSSITGNFEAYNYE